ncbi:MAG: IPTL-CTERM sorting domain-containing protein [Deltaproteobacteria bacterium]|nr:IPTL-CTERM sorting domain-containing protein [Deltaproteobacteria bacterium]
MQRNEPCGPELPIPSLNQWGMIVLTVLIGLGAIFYLRRRKSLTRAA